MPHSHASIQSLLSVAAAIVELCGGGGFITNLRQ